jgi:Glycosyltransferase 61
MLSRSVSDEIQTSGRIGNPSACVFVQCVVEFQSHFQAENVPAVKMRRQHCHERLDANTIARPTLLSAILFSGRFYGRTRAHSSASDSGGLQISRYYFLVPFSSCVRKQCCIQGVVGHLRPTDISFIVSRMQQLYRCSSWWFANPNKKPILLFDRPKELYNKPFIRGFLEVLEKGIGLKVVDNHTGPMVIAKDTQKWELDIEVTDFAMYDPKRQLRKVFASQILGHVDPSCPSQQARFPRIAILNRLDKSQRSLINAKKIAASIKAVFPDQIQKVPIVYFEGKTFLEQVKFFLETDIVISPHGAQLTALAFLPPCAALVEFFPKEYLVADYFGSLARAINISHSFFYLADGFDNPEIVMGYEKYHYYVTADYRHFNQCPAVKNVTLAVKQLVKNWEVCCSMTVPGDSPSDVIPAVHFPISGIDIVAVDGPSSTAASQSTNVATQAQIIGAHPLVRTFHSITNDPSDRDLSCSLEFIANSLSDLVLHKDYSDCSFSTRDAKPREWLCAQKRFINGFYRILKNYEDGTVAVPDYLVLIQNDTYVNMDALVATLQESYSPNTPQLVAACTNVNQRGHRHLVYPVSGFGSFLTRTAVNRMIQPISCKNETKRSDNFVRWACWRLKQNYTGEQLLFEDGMSIHQLMYLYFSKFLDMPVERWNHTGYCFHRSDHTMAYFMNYYHVSVPDWVLEAPIPVDKVRKQFSFRKLVDSTEVGHSGAGGECDHLYSSCTSESRFCHPLSVDEMGQLHGEHAKAL